MMTNGTFRAYIFIARNICCTFAGKIITLKAKGGDTMKMNRVFVIAVTITVLFCVSSMWATTITIGRVSGYYSGSGGEFTVINSGLNGNYSPFTLVNLYGTPGIQTFCLEKSEHISGYGTYEAFINPDKRAVNGGADLDPDEGDRISVGTAFLYYQFAKGILGGYDYLNTTIGGRESSAADLQNAIWWLEDEISMTDPTANPFLNAVLGVYGTDGAKLDAADTGVGVFNLYTLEGELAQDQIILTPEPSILLLTGFGLLGLTAGFVRKR